MLIIDDYGTMADAVRNMLVRMGFDTVDVTSHGGRLTYDTGRDGFVISDRDKRPVTDIEFLQRMRENPALTSTPIILRSADSKPQRAVAADLAGAAAFLVKPFTAEVLRAAVETALAR